MAEIKNLEIDIESFSDVDLTKCGVYKYASAPDFEVILFAYSVDGGPVRQVDLACGEKIPAEIIAALEDDTVTKWAFNANFERVCLSRYLGYPTGDYLMPDSWRCSMVWAAYLGLPLSLEGVGTVLGLEKQKLTEGKNLIKYFCQPCSPTKSNGGRTRNLPADAPEKWEAFKTYNIRDVEVEMAIQARLNGEPYFVGKDIAEILGYANTRDALAKHVDEEDRMDGVAIRDSIGREQTPVLINESGLYSLILSSKLPSAKRFKRWVTSEVLPAIRRHGVFALDDIVNNTDALIEALQAFKAERLRRMALEQEAAVQKQQLAEMRPKASYYDVVLNSPSLLAVSEFAKDYGWSAKRMNQYLHEKGVQYKQGGKIWLLYQKYAGCGYTSTKTHAYPAHDGTTHTKVHTYWTQKGRLFIYDLLKADGILPLIERGN